MKRGQGVAHFGLSLLFGVAVDAADRGLEKSTRVAHGYRSAAEARENINTKLDRKTGFGEVQLQGPVLTYRAPHPGYSAFHFV